MSESIVVQKPEEPAQQLVLLFHGVGSQPDDLLALGRRLAARLPLALVVSVSAPDRFEFGAGFQWFSIGGVSDDNRPARVAAAMPAFRAEVERWQQQAGLNAEATALIGFSQGAIMCLESTRGGEPLAARVVALEGRFAVLPALAPERTTFHFVHGKQDPVIHYRHTIEAAERLIGLGGDVTADVIPFVGHEINDEVIELVLERLTGYVPKRMWEQALSAEGGLDEDDGAA